MVHTFFSAFLVQYLLFIVDHSELGDNHPLCKWNIWNPGSLKARSRAQPESNKQPISNSYLIYRFEQTIQSLSPLTYVFDHKDILPDYYWQLEKEMLRKDTERLGKQHVVSKHLDRKKWLASVNGFTKHFLLLYSQTISFHRT
jgi:hypothetical protein